MLLSAFAVDSSGNDTAAAAGPSLTCSLNYAILGWLKPTFLRGNNHGKRLSFSVCNGQVEKIGSAARPSAT